MKTCRYCVCGLSFCLSASLCVGVFESAFSWGIMFKHASYLPYDFFFMTFFSLFSSSWNAVMLLICGNAEIPLNIFIGRINGRLAYLSVRRKWEWPAFFNFRCGLFFFFFLFSGIFCVIMIGRAAIRRSTNHCRCLRISRHLSSWVEWAESRQYEADLAWLQLQFIKKAKISCLCTLSTGGCKQIPLF